MTSNLFTSRQSRLVGLGIALMTIFVGVGLWATSAADVQAFPAWNPRPFDTQTAHFTNLAIDKWGTVHVVYHREETDGNHIYYTFSQGTSFAQPIHLGAGYNPSLALTAAGTVHVVWIEEVDAFSANLWYSTGSASSTFTTTNLGEYDGLDRVALAAESDRVHLVFQADASGYAFGAILYTYSESGEPFVSPNVVSTGFTGGVESPEISLDTAGNVYIAFFGNREHAGDDLLAYTHNSGGSFTSPVDITTINWVAMDNGISLATGPAGSLHVAYYDGVNGLFYTSNMGGSFSTPTRLTEYGDAPCLTVDDAGTAHLLYQATPSDALQHGATYTNNASGDFATPQTIFQNYDWADDRSQRWCVLRDNYVYMAINVDGIGSYLLHDLQIPRLPFETHPLVQDYDARTDTLTSLALDNDDHVHVAYMSTYPQNGAPDNVASDIMVTNNTTGEFSEPITVPVSGGYYSKSPSLAVDGEGTEHVVFLRTENQLDAEGIFYYTHNRSGAFISPTIITSDGIGVAQVVADRDGHAYIVYPSGDNLYYVDNLTGNFSTPLSVGTAGSFTPFSMALDNENMVHVAYMGEDTNLYYTHMTATGFMSPTHVSIVDALANEFSDPSLALDSSGNAHIVFESSDAPLNEQTIYVNNQGSTFAYTETVYTQGPRSHSPAIAIDGLDHIHVVHLSPGQNWPNNIEYSVNRGDGFAPSQILWNWGSAYGENRWFAVDHQYRAHLAFYFPIHSMEADIFYIQGFVGDFYRITGYIWNTMGSGIPGVDVRFTARSGETLTTTTDATGYFSEGEYAGTFANGIYTVTVASESEHFIPEQQVVTVDGTHEVGITFRRVQAVEAATIGGPITGTVGTTYPFSLDFTPLSATQPLSYTWHPIPLEGQGTANITYRWATSGTYTISATVTNISGEATDNHTITIQAQAPEEKYLLYLPLLLRL